MNGLSSRKRGLAVLAYVFLVIATGWSQDSLPQNDTSQMLVGSWYGERKHSGQFADKAFNHRRWLIVHRADGTAQDIQRYYLDDKIQGEFIEQYKWGVDNNVYWNVCQKKIRNGVDTSCSDRSEYQVLSVTSREFRYRSLKSHIEYSVVRVPTDFQLP